MAPRSKGPVVDTQMPSMGDRRPSLTPAGGVYGHNKAPFDAPQSMGNGGIPTKFFDDTLSAKVAGRTQAQPDTPGTRATSPTSNMMSPGKVAPQRRDAKAPVPKNNK